MHLFSIRLNVKMKAKQFIYDPASALIIASIGSFLNVVEVVGNKLSDISKGDHNQIRLR